jgi:hypothetical protein
MNVKHIVAASLIGILLLSVPVAGRAETVPVPGAPVPNSAGSRVRLAGQRCGGCAASSAAAAGPPGIPLRLVRSGDRVAGGADRADLRRSSHEQRWAPMSLPRSAPYLDLNDRVLDRRCRHFALPKIEG